MNKKSNINLSPSPLFAARGGSAGFASCAAGYEIGYTKNVLRVVA